MENQLEYCPKRTREKECVYVCVRERERERERAERADCEKGSRSPAEGPKSIKTLIERAEKTMEPARLRR